jgi:lipopolysaccharide heptosyltransferase II
VKILIIQNAFTGDVILATGVLEKLHHAYPAAKLDFLLRKGNEGLFKDHPYLHELIVWDKGKDKYSNLLSIAKKIRASEYEYVINLQRFGSSGFLTAFSKAKHRIGFDKNPFSFLFSKKVPHDIGKGKHEIERNQELIRELTDDKPAKPRLYPSKADYATAAAFQKSGQPYICIAPTSIWFTKQYPQEKWIEFIKSCSSRALQIFLLGAQGDAFTCEAILQAAGNPNTVNLAGKLSLLQSAALMQGAQMNYVNDSAPMHLASAMNAPVAAIFCSTVPAFGFGPLSDTAFVIETSETLTCRPCGLHGHKVCPEGHFKCAFSISNEKLMNLLPK